MNEIPGLTAHGLSRQLAAGEITSLAATEASLDRIAALDDGLHAFLRVNPRAADEAGDADRRLADGEATPLTGVPIAIKDNINTAGLETTCASRSLAGFEPLRDATAVERLRSAGAVIVGKTNLDEFGMGSSTENSAFAATRNPWNRDCVPGGSSGGSAVAVATRMTPVALGSDTGGSVRQPAALCGVVGLKPTYGRVSRSGLVAFGSSLDQVGTLSASVRDAASVLSVIAGEDPCDATSSSEPVDDYIHACGRGVDGLTIALPSQYFGEGLDPEIEQAVRRGAEVLETAGARVREFSLPHTRYSVPTYYLVATAEASSNLARYDAVRYGQRVDPGEGLAEMYRASRGAGLGPEVKRRIMLGTYALSAGYYEAFYGKAQRVRTLLRRDFLAGFEEGIDLYWTPTTPTTAFRLGERVDDPLAMYLSDVYTVTVSLAGLPALSVPLGRGSDGLPFAGQLIGPDFGESLLFQAGAVLEQAFPAELPPEVAS